MSPKAEGQPGATILNVAGLSTAGSGTALADVSLTIRAGEIVGLAGVDGNGQAELIEALLGLRRISAGTIALKDRPIAGLSTAEIIRRGLVEIPADRHAAAVVEDLGLTDNALLTFSGSARFAPRGWLRRTALQNFAASIVERFRIKTPSHDAPMRTLSGGNQQRFVFGRALGHAPAVLIAAQPTRGLDIASTAFVRRTLVGIRDAGKSVLLVSMDLDEIMALSDRIAVMVGGRIVGILTPQAGRNAIGLMMAGATSPDMGPRA